MAKLLPYESYSLASPLSTDQIILKLLHNTLTAQEYVSESDKRIFSFGLKAWSKPYWGYIRNDSFELQRLINYRNLGNPKISGVLKPLTSGTAIQIKMRPGWATTVFIGFALLICLYALGFSVVQSIKTNQIHNGVIVSSGMLVFLYLLLLVPFKAEALKSKQLLSGLFDKAHDSMMNTANRSKQNV